MADYRQRMVDYILEKYPTYSHMIVIDLDLKVSLSPFGILHSLGNASGSGSGEFRTSSVARKYGNVDSSL